ncbi:translation initiation factor IF-2 N-terminal domain-containing protein [Streptomyces sp. NPDC002156]
MSADFLIGTDEAGKPVYLPDAVRCEHVTIIGATGTGKTTLLERLILADIENQTSCALIDAHGDLTENLLRKTPIDAKSRMHLLEVSEDRPFGLNLLEREPQEGIDVVASEVLLVFKRMFEGESEFRPQLENDLDLIIHTLLATGGYTLAEALELLHNKSFRGCLTSRLTNRAHLVAWEEYNSLSPRDRSNRNAPLFNRLNPFLASERIRNIVGQSKTTVPLQWVMDTPGQALLIRLPVGAQGSELESKFLGNLFVCQLARLIFRRTGSSSRNRFHLYLDEYGRYATPTTARLFTDIRKYQVGLTVAHQTLADVGDEKQKTAELQAGTLACFHPASGSDADELSRSMPVSPRPAENPPCAISLTPVRQLLDGRHQSAVVQAITRRLLIPLQELIDSGSNIGVTWNHTRGHDPYPGYQLRNEELRDGMRLLNSLLVDAMKQELVPGPKSIDFVSRFASVIVGLKFYVGADWATGSDEEITGATRERLAHIDILLTVPQIKPIERRDLRLAVNPTPWDSMGFIGDLYSLCKLLARDPLYLSLPGHQARPQQTYADAQAELANDIRNLPNHYAYVRIRTAEDVRVVRVQLSIPAEGPIRIVTPKLLLPGGNSVPRSPLFEDDFKMLASQVTVGDTVLEFTRKAKQYIAEMETATYHMRRRCHEQFGTPRSEVEEQIRKRQMRPPPDDGQAAKRTTKPKGPPPPVSPPPKSTIGRRSPQRDDAVQRQQTYLSNSSTSIRVYELAKELGVKNQVVMDKIREIGEYVHSAASTIDAPVAYRLRQAFQKLAHPPRMHREE